jgi:hypothetical protein
MTLVTLRTRRDLSRSLRELSARQREALEGQDYDALIGLLSEKRSVIDRLVMLTPSAHDWMAKRQTLPVSEREEGEALLSETNRLLAEINDAERVAVDELTSQRERTRSQLLEINAAGRVHSAYRDSLAPVTRRSLDVDR